MVSNVASSVKELVCPWTSGGPRVDIRVGAIEEPGGRITPPFTPQDNGGVWDLGCSPLESIFKKFLVLRLFQVSLTKVLNNANNAKTF